VKVKGFVLLILIFVIISGTAQAQNSDVSFYQRRLEALSFRPGPIDGKMGPKTRDSLTAFQKSYDLPVSGELCEETKVALEVPSATPPLKPEGNFEGLYFEIDTSKQILSMIEDREVQVTLNVSTGKNDKTPVREEPFRIYEKVDSGWVTAIGRDGRPQGQMYKPLKFFGPYYIHGSKNVPGYPASLGCIRVQPRHMDWLHEISRVGTKVLIY